MQVCHTAVACAQEARQLFVDGRLQRLHASAIKVQTAVRRCTPPCLACPTPRVICVLCFLRWLGGSCTKGPLPAASALKAHEPSFACIMCKGYACLGLSPGSSEVPSHSVDKFRLRCCAAQALSTLLADRQNLTLSQNIDFGLRQVVVPPPPPPPPRSAGSLHAPGGPSAELAEVAALAAPGGLTATLAQLSSRVWGTGTPAPHRYADRAERSAYKDGIRGAVRVWIEVLCFSPELLRLLRRANCRASQGCCAA